MKWWVGLHSGAMLYEKYVSLNTKHSAEWDAPSTGSRRQLTTKGGAADLQLQGQAASGSMLELSDWQVTCVIWTLPALFASPFHCCAPGIKFAQIKCIRRLHWTYLWNLARLAIINHWLRIMMLHRDTYVLILADFSVKESLCFHLNCISHHSNCVVNIFQRWSDWKSREVGPHPGSIISQLINLVIFVWPLNLKSLIFKERAQTREPRGLSILNLR